MLTKTAEKLYVDGLIKIEHMPIQFRNNSYAIHTEPLNPTGIKFAYYEEIGQPPLFVNTNLNAAQVRSRTKRLVAMYLKDPSTIHLEV